ncbi:MAG: rubrerythrin [Calditrichaeota bacterium]|nr:rubrerythrin [Calditrichota bacterium]
MPAFKDLSQSEILALAISLEEEDGRILEALADAIEAAYPQQADEFRRMRAEEDDHRHRLLDIYRARFGEHIPLIRRQDVKGFVARKPVWLMKPLTLARAKREVESMEVETRRFYEAAIRRTTDAGIRQLLGDLAEEERRHAGLAQQISRMEVTLDEKAASHRLFVLQVIQPGLAGLMDGSVSTLAPLFAAAYATMNSWETFLVGMAASIGAGISMGFAEALSDDGSMTGRGAPWIRGVICGLMTTIGGIGHTLPFLIPDVHLATTVAVAVVVVELGVIAWVRKKYMETPLGSAIVQVVIGGALVFAAGVLIGGA